MNLLMHFGQGVLLGSLRGIMAEGGLRGPWSSAMFTAVRLTNDQTLENATGVGAPPWTWPRQELVVDIAHKAVYAFATGLVADALAARSGPGPGGRHAGLRPGRHAGVGPPSRPQRADVDLDAMLCWEDEFEVRLPDGGPRGIIGMSMEGAVISGQEAAARIVLSSAGRQA